METMQFGGFIFSHNPEIITVEQSSPLASHICPGKGELWQSLGSDQRKITCKGCFVAKSYGEASSQVENFRRESSKSRLLFVPGMAPFMARLHSFVLEASGDGRILPYTIVFVEEVLP